MFVRARTDGRTDDRGTRERDGEDASGDVVVDVGTRGAVRDALRASWGGDESRGGNELGRRGFEPRMRGGDVDGTGEAVVSIERVGFRR